MELAVYLAPGATGTAPKWSRAFAQGCGGSVRIGGPFRSNRPFAFWGQPVLWDEFARARSVAPAWFYGDHAFFGRGQFYRCARNALQFDGSFGDDDPARFRKFAIPIRDWRKSGSRILLCPNSEAFFAMRGFRPGQWVSETIAAIGAVTDRPIRVRWKTEAGKRALDEDLKDCFAVVTFVSNSAVMAALAGVPVFCTAPCAGLTMGSGNLSEIERPAMPAGRERWAARLANRQWTLDEMRSGMLWSVLGH